LLYWIIVGLWFPGMEIIIVISTAAAPTFT
jgi:hypothetical protein